MKFIELEEYGKKFFINVDSISFIAPDADKCSIVLKNNSVNEIVNEVVEGDFIVNESYEDVKRLIMTGTWSLKKTV